MSDKNIDWLKRLQILDKALEENGVRANFCVDTFGKIGYRPDFSKHDKRFEDEIASLKRQIEKLESIRMRCHESARDSFDSGMYGLLHIVTADELKNTKDNIQKINLNETIKVKLTPLGAEIYYKQFDELNKQYEREICKPQMPQIDKDGYTEFQLWHFIELYGEHIGMCKPNVIEPLDIVYCGNDKYHSDNAE